MDWQQEHERRVASFPPAIQVAHVHCTRHRAEVKWSKECGCFYCCETFPPSEILEWTDEDEQGVGQTALCPRCGIDSVIGDASGFRPEPGFLEQMRACWFDDA
jgi:hypothetical protein